MQMIPDMNGHQKYLIEEFAEDYKQNTLNRRDLLKRVLMITGSVTATASVLTILGCGPGETTTSEVRATTTPAATSQATAAASAPAVSAIVQIPESDPAIQIQNVSFPGDAGQVQGYLARPRAAG